MQTKIIVKKLDSILYYQVYYKWLNLFWIKYSEPGYPNPMFTWVEANQIRYKLSLKKWYQLFV